MTEYLKAELQKRSNHILFDEEMKKHTSFKIGGPADVFAEPSCIAELQRIIAFAKEYEIPYLITGNGSNMLVSDKGISGIVIKIGQNMQGYHAKGNVVYAECGILLSRLANLAAHDELSGLEFAAGIPGTLGGGIYMNAGAYGGEMKDIVTKVTYIDEDGCIQSADAEQLDFSYRHSMFSERKCVLLSCEIQLKKEDSTKIKEKMADFQKRRIEKQPLELPSAGSTFKRPAGYFAAKLIEDAGLKGYTIGGASVSQKHAGFVVNTGNATCSDVLALIAHIQKTVMEKFQVKIETEVKVIGR